MPAPDTPNARAASRAARFGAIVEATRTLATERGAHGFTIEQVASLAGVSRRTVFNHVAGIDQLLVAVCEQILTEVTDDLLVGVDRLTADLPAGPEGHRRALTALGEAAREVDLPAAIVTIHRVLGGPDAPDERAAAISRTAFEHVGGRLRHRLRDRAPALDPLDLELDLTLLTSGLALFAEHWLEHHPDLTPAPTTDVLAAARADWDRLLDRLLVRLHAGLPG